MADPCTCMGAGLQAYLNCSTHLWHLLLFCLSNNFAEVLAPCTYGWQLLGCSSVGCHAFQRQTFPDAAMQAEVPMKATCPPDVLPLMPTGTRKIWTCLCGKWS